VPPLRALPTRDTDVGRLLGLALAATAAFALVAYATFEVPRLRHLDARLFADASAHKESRLGQVANVVADLGDPAVQGLLLVLGLGVALAGGRREAALAGLVIVLGADLTTTLLKQALAGPRFDPILGWGQVDLDAFPSGHTTAAFSMAAAWTLFVPPRMRLATAVVGFAAACGVAASVVIRHHHFPSDTLGGFLVVVAWTAAVLAVLQLCSFAQEDDPDGATFEA
jgi:membrane-associated phospholipid phosphatase